MSRRSVRTALLAAGLSLPLAVGLGAGAASASAPAHAAGHAKRHAARVCTMPAKGSAACHAEVVTDASGKPQATTGPAGYGPGDLQSAYKLPAAPASVAPNAPTVAIVDAYNNPRAESDLATYRSTYGLPACTTGNRCFKKVNQSGSTTSLPSNSGSWSQEISLDLDMVSAACPACKILLVEAKTPSFANLGAAELTAARLNAVAISNSYGGSDASDATYGKYYNVKGHAVTVSSGDNGYGAEYPASSQYVTAVGGTSLYMASGTSRGWSETAWSGAGSGCSTYNTKPSWQRDTGCSRRTVADVSAVADPNTGVAVYDSYAYQGSAGWLVFGGTSAASPIIASVYAAAGNASGVTYGSYPYSHTGSLNDVTAGSNGNCGGSYLCTGGQGYDGPTGLGTPNGTTAF